MRIGYSLLFLSFLLLLTACTSEQIEGEEGQQVEGKEQQRSEEETSTEKKGEQKDNVQNESNDTSEEEGLFAQFVKEIYFFQQDENGRSQDGIYEFTEETLPTEPTTFALHDESMYVFLTFATTDQATIDKIFNQINIRGASDQNIEQTRATRYKIQLPKTEEQVTFQFGRLPEISFDKKKPLSMTVEPEQGDCEALLFKNEKNPNSIVFPQYFFNEKAINHLIHFSEAMQTDIDVAEYMTGRDVNANGEWLDNKTYKLRIEKKGTNMKIETSERNDVEGRILSQEGNYLPYETIQFNGVEKRGWKNLNTGEKVGWSSRDFLYDFLLFSPDRSSYIGVTEIAEGEGDAEGSFYGFTLEQKGKSSKQLVRSNYTSVMRKGVPLEWVDNEHIMYSDDANVFKLNVESGERETLLAKEQHEGSINQYAYNPSNGDIYVLVEQFNKTFENSTVNRWTYNQDKDQWNQEKNYSELPQSGIYWAKSLSVYMTSDGVLFSKAEDGQIYTVHEKESGENSKVLGEVILQTDEGVYLKVRTGRYNNDLDQLYFWNLGGEDPIQIENPPGPTPAVHPFNSYLLSFNQGAHSYVYNKQSDRWERNDQFNPVFETYNFQEVAPIYRE